MWAIPLCIRKSRPECGTHQVSKWVFAERKRGRWERSRAGKIGRRFLISQTCLLRDMKTAFRYQSQEGSKALVNQMGLVVPAQWCLENKFYIWEALSVLYSCVSSLRFPQCRNRLCEPPPPTHKNVCRKTATLSVHGRWRQLNYPSWSLHGNVWF